LLISIYFFIYLINESIILGKPEGSATRVDNSMNAKKTAETTSEKQEKLMRALIKK
jgi:hypothetical protein